MSYFAVLSDAEFSVTHCHINIWLSPKRWRNHCVFDVGLGLKSSGQLINDAKLKLAVPFGAAACEDISPLLRDVDTGSLVFGEHISVEQRNKETLLSGPSVSLRLSTCAPKNSAEYSNSDGSVWEVGVHAGICSEVSTYVRLRFSVSYKSLWKSDRSGGALLDFRVADTRGALAHETWRGLNKFVEIESLNIFVIVPTFCSVESNNPSFAYVRVLEQQLWRKYLGVHFPTFSGRMLVRHWKVRPGEGPIGPTKPYAAFMQIRESFSDQMRRNAIRTILWTSVISAILVVQGPRIALQILSVWEAAGDIVRKGSLLVALVAVLAIPNALVTFWRHVEWLKERILSWFRKHD